MNKIYNLLCFLLYFSISQLNNVPSGSINEISMEEMLPTKVNFKSENLLTTKDNTEVNTIDPSSTATTNDSGSPINNYSENVNHLADKSNSAIEEDTHRRKQTGNI